MAIEPMSFDENTYLEERRIDSLMLVIPAIVIVTVFISFVLVALISLYEISRYWSLWACLIGSPVIARYTRKLANERRQIDAGYLFVMGHVLLISLALSQFWNGGVNAFIIYLNGVFIIISGMMIAIRAPFIVWLISTVLTFAVLSLTNQLEIDQMNRILPAIFVNLLLAGVSFLSAYDWELALDSVTQLHIRAQRRRDELFDMKEQLSRTNSELVFLNDQLDAARREALNERDLRTRFMNNVSHELRTPLNAIVNFANILARGGRGPVTDPQVDYMERIERSGWHLLEVLNDLLDMAQIESGEFKLQMEMADLEPLCEDAMEKVRGLIMGRDAEVDLVRDYPEVWPKVQVDTMRLKQALINLLGNAAKYTEEGHIALRVLQQEDEAVIIIEDSGIGIAPEHHQAIFREFHQVDQSAARKRIGTGLGLPLTRHLIERHGGRIELDSDVGRGSRFMIFLPLVDAAVVPVNGSEG